MDTPLDLANPPKYCPGCASKGLKKRVVKYLDDEGKDDYMCKNPECPWPFNTRKQKRKKKKRSREEAEEVGHSQPAPPVSPEHKKPKLSERKTEKANETKKKPAPPSPPSTSTDIEVAGFMTPTLPSTSTLHSHLALSCTPSRAQTTSSDKSGKESDIKIDSSVSFLGALPTREQDASPVDTPKPLLGTLSSSEGPDHFNQALASSSPIVKPDSSTRIVAPCSPGHILDTSSPSYNIPSPGSAFNLVSPKHRRLSMEDEKSMGEEPKSPQQDLEMKSGEAVKRRLSSSGESKSKVNKTSCAEDLDSELLDYEPEPSLGSESEKESTNETGGLASENIEIELTSQPGPSGMQPTSEGKDPNFTAMPTKIRPPLRLPKHASQMLSSRASRDPSPETQPPEVFDEIDGDGDDNESEEDVMADADDSDSELESLASECSTMSTISDAGSVDSLNGFGKKKRRGKKKKRKDRRKVHMQKCTKTSGVRPSDLSFKDLAQLDNSDTEVENLETSKSLITEKGKIESEKTKPSQIEECPPDVIDKMSVSPPSPIEETSQMDIESPARKMISESPMQSSEKENKSLKVEASSEMCDDDEGDLSPEDMDSESADIKLFKHGMAFKQAPLSPMSLTDTDDQSDDARKVKTNKGRGKKKILLPKFRTPAAPVKRSGVKVMLPANIQESEDTTLLEDEVLKELPANIQEIDDIYCQDEVLKDSVNVESKVVKVMLPENIQEQEDIVLEDSKDLESKEIDIDDKTWSSEATSIATQDGQLTKEGKQIEETGAKDPSAPSEKGVFKSPSKPTSESSTVSDAHVFLSPAHAMPSPQYSTLPSPSHPYSLPSPSHPYSLPSPGHFSTPSLLSPMPPTPKDDTDEDPTTSRPLKLLLKRDSHNVNGDWTSSDKEQPDNSGLSDSEQLKAPGRMRKGGSLDKVVLNLQKSVGGQWQKTLPANKDQTEGKKTEELSPPAHSKTSRKERKTKETKRIDNIHKPENEKENECDLLPQSKAETPSSTKVPKKRGRPPKNKESSIFDAESDTDPLETVSPPTLHKKVETAEGKRTIKLTPCRPPTSLFSLSPGSPRFPPSPASLPPSPRVVEAESIFSEKSVKSTDPSISSKSSSSRDKTESGDDDLLANVSKALAVQNTKANDKLKKSNLDADSSLDMSQDQSDDSVSSQEKVPLKTFSRAKQQLLKKGKPIQNLRGGKGTLTNMLILASGVEGISANVIEDESAINIAPELLNVWNLASSSHEDPDFDSVKKIGAGMSSDKAFLKDHAFLNQFIPNLATEDAGNVIFHVSRGSSLINLPRQEDRTQVKQQNDTKIDLTADSDEIDVHALRLVSSDISAYPGARAAAKVKSKAASSAAAITENLLRATKPKDVHREFGEDWFTWEDWKIDGDFMKSFYETINRMMQERNKEPKVLPPIPGLNPIIQMLYSKKRDIKYNKLDLDKMVRFFAAVGVKYWYAVNTCQVPVQLAIDSLKTDPLIDNQEYVNKIKNMNLEYIAKMAKPARPDIKKILEKQRPVSKTDLTASAKISAITEPMSPRNFVGLDTKEIPPEIKQLALGARAPVAHQSGQTMQLTLTRTNDPPLAHSGLKNSSLKGGLAITNRTTLPLSQTTLHRRVEVTPGLVPPASPGSRPINLSKMMSPARPGQGFASPRIFTTKGSPAQPVYHELQVVRPREGQDGRAVIARQAAGVKSPAVSASPRYVPASPRHVPSSSRHVPASPRYFAPSPRYENPSTPCVDSPGGPMSVQSMNSNPASVQPMSIKQEYDIVEQTPGNPGSVNISSVLDNNLCSVQMINSVNPEMRNKRGKIGTGSKCVQFFYENENDSPAFPAVYVNTTDEVRAVAALVAEKAGDFKRRGGGNRGEIPQYYTEAAKAKYILEKVVIKHIEQCFTKKGMREFKVGVKKRNYPKRSTIIKINALGEKQNQTPDGATIKVERLDHEEQPEEDDDLASICSGPPNDADHMQQIESIVFGSRMPKAKSIKFNSEKATVGDTGKGSKRGGKNKLDYKNPSSPMMMGVVNDLLQRSKSMEAQRTDHELERAEEEAVDDVDQEDADAVDVALKKPLKVSTSFLRKKRSIGNAVLSPEKSKSKSAKTDDSDGEDMDNILSGSGEQLNVGQKESENVEKESDKVAGGEKTKTVPKVYAKKKNSNDKASTEVNKETEGNDDNLLEQRKQLKCGNMVAFAPDVLDEVNDSKEGIKKIENLPENLTKEASQNVKKSYRVKHPNKSWKEMNEEAQNSNEKEMAEMVRSVSRGSRPSSQASLSDSRPDSRVEEFSRPSSQTESSPTRRLSARRVFGEHLGQTEEPHPDSPVMGTRHKRIIEEKETVVKPSAKPKAADKFSMEALKEFENTFVRKGAADKVKFLMKKKEKKAMKKKNKNSRYRGFGETSDPKEDEKPKKPKEVKEKVKKVTVEDPVTEVMKHRKDKISLEEKNLMNELLQFADSAVTPSTPSTPSTSGANKTLQSPSSGASKSQVKEKAKIFVDFEEAQTLTSDNAIGDEDFLVDLI